MKRPIPLIVTAATLVPTLFAQGAAAGLEPRLRGCYDAFIQCMDAVPEAGPDGRYPLRKEQACDVAYDRCKMERGFPPSAGRPGRYGGATAPSNYDE